MRIILTHEQADFDALASLLGASLLDDSATPVLPRRMNRNVSAFLTLYGVDFPFVDPRDLPNEPIEAVTLVDTQSLVSIRGMNAQTRVHVIDHHPLREGLPADWTVATEETGATTTLLLEALRERNGVMPSSVQATLLLLGIYEDTGSLTYTRTTPRDLRSAAYLLEIGANLQIASSFLNHPLSPAQQDLYDRLRANAEHFHIHGHTVIVTCGNAEGLDEELSSIAHKLRDLLDPDALFLLVTTRGGVQMIARSTSDNIDVSAIVGQFGGGGHERAAAGLVRGRDVDNIRAELVRLIPQHVRPAITVVQIMSRSAQVLSPSTPVEEAALRMRRYGYEGYPVVKDNRVLGLLTRRAVDRALAHKLNLTAASLMEAGQVIVHPNDSLEHLQRLMTETGWGQIPVVQPESGEIIGIVTRTDLLKTLTPQPKLPGRHNLAERLETALPAGRLALLKAVAGVASEQHCALYIVGGFVRDLLLERPSLDFDLVVEGDAIHLARALAARFGGRMTSHSRFGTAKWQFDDTAGVPLQFPALGNPDPASLPASLDFVTARTEFYTHPTALPTVERGSIKLDLHRRDFTINTLALRLDGRHYGELHDYWGGLDDLRHGLVRVLHSLSFVDDPTRMLRAARFEQRFGFRIETRTLELLREAVSLLDRVSGDRVRHELDHILEEQRAPHILARLEELSLLQAIHPELKWDTWLESRLESLQSKQPDVDWRVRDEPHFRRNLAYLLWLLRLSPEAAQSVADRLKMTSEKKEMIVAACCLWRDLPSLSEAPPYEITLRLEEVPSLSLYAVYLATSDIHVRKNIQTFVTRWHKVEPTVTGHDLKARGLPPGPAYRSILSALRKAWLEETVTTPEEETILLESLIQEQSAL